MLSTDIHCELKTDCRREQQFEQRSERLTLPAENRYDEREVGEFAGMATETELPCSETNLPLFAFL